MFDKKNWKFSDRLDFFAFSTWAKFDSRKGARAPGELRESNLAQVSVSETENLYSIVILELITFNWNEYYRLTSRDVRLFDV